MIKRFKLNKLFEPFTPLSSGFLLLTTCIFGYWLGWNHGLVLCWIQFHRWLRSIGFDGISDYYERKGFIKSQSIRTLLYVIKLILLIMVIISGITLFFTKNYYYYYILVIMIIAFLF